MAGRRGTFVVARQSFILASQGHNQ